MKRKLRFAIGIGVAILFACLALIGCPDNGDKDTAPAAPATVNVTGGDEQLSVTWTAATDATAYEVWYGTTTDSAAAEKFGDDVTVTNATITGLTNGTTYYVWVKAKNSHGTSDFSSSANGVPTGPTEAGEADELAGKLLIWQVFGDNGRADQVSHNFIELYNNSDAIVNLDGYSLQYAAGDNSAEATEDQDWEVIDLSGHTIPVGASFLVLGSKNGEDSRYMIPDNSGDINNSMQINNRAFKVALIKSTDKLTVQNPFNMDDNGATAAGYVDMVASLNTPGTDVIRGFEGSIDNLPRHSAQEAIRRFSLTDTNNNGADFESVRYGQPSGIISVPINENVKEDMFAFYGPKNTEHGNWDPTDVPEPEAPAAPTQIIPGNKSLTVMWAAVAFANTYEVYYNTTDDSATATKLDNDAEGVSASITGLEDNTEYFVWVKAKARYSDFTSEFSPSASGSTLAAADAKEPGLLILQANTYGNANNATTGSGLPASAIELYNNSDNEIDFDAEDYYLHIGGTNGWLDVIKLTGSVPSKHSYLIVSTTDVSTNLHRAKLPTGDIETEFVIPNDNFTIAIMKDLDELPEGNPFGNADLADNYVDMFGVGNTVGFEGTAFSGQSRPRVPRRASLADTDDNSKDFIDIDYRGSSTTAPSDADLYKVWPRSTAMGEWDPITGEEKKDPEPRD